MDANALKIDLSNRSYEVETLPEKIIKQYVTPTWITLSLERMLEYVLGSPPAGCERLPQQYS